MPLQQLINCNITPGGSYTNNVISFNVVTHSYYERATRTSSRTAKLSPSDSISNLLLEAERLQRTTKELSRQLKLTTRFECEDLATTLDDIVNETIPYVFRFSLNDHRSDMHCQRQIINEIACMQNILDDFASKSDTDTRHPFAVAIVNDLPFETQYLILKIRKSLSASRDKIYITLFKSMASSLGKRIHCHQIDVDDFFGTQWSLPQDLCLNREAFFSILRFKFQGGPAELVVQSEQFGVFRQDGLRAIRAADWENVIKEGDGLQLSVFVNRQFEDMADDVPECPQCRQRDKTISGDSRDGWVTCLRCDSNFNVTFTDSELNSVDQTSYSSTFRCFSITFTRGHQQPFERGEVMQAPLEQQRQQMGINPAGEGQQPRRLTPQELTQRAVALGKSLRHMEDVYQKIVHVMPPGPEKDVRLQGLARDISVRREVFGKIQQALTQIAHIGGRFLTIGPGPWNISGFDNAGSNQPARPLPTQAAGPSLDVQPGPPHVHRTLIPQPKNQSSGMLPLCSGSTPSQQALHPPHGAPGRGPVGATPENPFGTQMLPSMGQLFLQHNNSVSNSANHYPSAPGVQQMLSGCPPGGGAWSPALSNQKVDAAFTTSSARAGIKHEAKLMTPSPSASNAGFAGFNAASSNTGKRPREEKDQVPGPSTSAEDADAWHSALPNEPLSRKRMTG